MADQTTHRFGIENDFIDSTLSSTILTGGVITDSTGSIDISAITALIRMTDSATGILTKITVDAQYGLTPALVDTKYYIILKYNNGSPTISLETDHANRTTEIGIGFCLLSDGTVHYSNSGMRLQNGLSKLHRRAYTLRNIEIGSGCTIGETGTRNFTVATGVIYEGINRIELSSFSSLVGKFTYIYKAADWVYVDDQTTIDNIQFNDYGVGLDDLDSNNYGCHWIYIHPDDGHVYVVYGIGTYTAADALIAQPPANLPSIISDFAVLIGDIIIKKSAATFYEIQMVTDVLFSGSGAADHNNLSTLQGGQVGEYYHLTSAEHTVATQAATDALNGYATSTQITKLDGIAENADVTGDNVPQAHKDSHDPENGSDPLDTAIPEEIAEVQEGDAGSSHSLARSDHTHKIDHGISDNHIVTIDSTSNIIVGDFSQFTSDGLRGRSAPQVMEDLSGVAAEEFSFNDQNITNVGDISLDSISSDSGTSINVVLGSDAGDDFTVDTDKLVVEGDTGNVGIRTTTPGTTLAVNGGQACKKTNVDDANYGTSALTTDYIVAWTALTAARTATISTEDEDSGTATLPRVMVFKDQTGSAASYNITISLESGGNIDGATTYVLNKPYQFVTLEIDGTNAYVIGGN